MLSEELKQKITSRTFWNGDNAPLRNIIQILDSTQNARDCLSAVKNL